MVACSDADFLSCRDYGEDFLLFLGNDHGERGQGSTFYTQIGESTLFTMSDTDDYIHVYDLNPATLSFHTLEPAIPITVGDAACLASSETPSPRLYITGGYMDISDYYEIDPFFWIFDLEEYSWGRGSDMNYARYSHGCIVADDMLWVMGTVPQIETINITDIDNAEWAVYNNLSIEVNLTAFGVVSSHGVDPQLCGMFGFIGTLCNDHSIYIIGGWIGDQDSGHNSDTVYIIDTKWGNMTYNALPFGVSELATVLFKGSIYGFGGWNATSSRRDGYSLDTSIKHQLLSDPLVTEELNAFLCLPNLQ